MKRALYLFLPWIWIAQAGCASLLLDDDDDSFRTHDEPEAAVTLGGLSLVDIPTEAGDELVVALEVAGVRGRPLVDFQVSARSDRGVILDLGGREIEVNGDGVIDFEDTLRFGEIEPGTYEISVLASFQDQALETGSFQVEWAPALEAVDLVEVTPQSVFSGDEVVKFVAKGRGMRGQRFRFHVVGRSQTTGQSSNLGAGFITFDDGVDLQHGEGSWRINGPFLDRVDVHEVVFSLDYFGQASESFLVDVPFVLRAIEFRAIDGETEVEALTSQRLDLRSAPMLAVVLHGEGLRGRVAGFEASPEGGAPVTGTVTASDDETVRWEYQPSRAFADNPVFNTDYLVTVEGRSIRSALTMVRWGFLRCAFLYENGAQITAGERFRSSVSVRMHVETWGVPNRDIGFDVFEEDSVRDDGQRSYRGLLEEGVADVPASLAFRNDGLGNTAEFRFSVRIGEAGCQSQLIKVVR